MFICHRMRTQFILIACLTIARQALGTRVYDTSISDSSQQWSQQESFDNSNVQEKYRPVTFESSDAQKETPQQPLYNANIQTSGSGVASVLTQQSVRITAIVK